jgi:hypothetical protein
MKSAIIVGSALASFCVEKFGPERMKEITRKISITGSASLWNWEF